jgi:hypothetical protein
MPPAASLDDSGWTAEHRELHALLAERSEVLADYYASAVYFLRNPASAARMSHLGHAIRELCMHLPDALKITRFDRSDTDGKVSALVNAWERSDMPDDPDDLVECSAGNSAVVAGCHAPLPVVKAAAALVKSTRVRGNYRRRAALMIVEPDAPLGHTQAEDHPTVARWVAIYDTLLPWVHRFDKSPQPIPEAQLADDFSFLEDVIRTVLAPLDVISELDDLLASTRPHEVRPIAADAPVSKRSDAVPRQPERPQADD